MINYNDGGLGYAPIRNVVNIDYKVYWFAAGFTPFKGVDVKGVYMIEDGLWETSKSMGFYANWDSSPYARKAIIDVSEDVLKFSTYERYTHYDQDTFGKAKELQIGVGYQYTANAAFYLVTGSRWTTS